MRTVRATAATLTAMLALAGFAAEAQACSCAFEDEADRFRASDAAVVLRLTSVVPLEGSDVSSTFYEARFHYKVRKIFKGPDELERGDKVVLRSSSQSSACGLPTQERRYAMYLTRFRGRFTANLCSVTNRGAMAEAAEEVGKRPPRSGGCSPG